MAMYLIAATLIIVGALFIYIGRRGGSRSQQNRQSHSVSVNGNSSGVIMNTNVGLEPPKEGGERRLIVTGIVIHTLGIGFALWEIYERHYAGR
jgi:hypothetical protein